MAEVGKVYEGIAAAREYFYKHGFEKSGFNNHQKFAFRAIDSLWPLIVEALKAGDLVLIPCVLDYERERGEKSIHSVVTTNFMVLSLKDGSKVESTFTGEGFDNGDKSMSKAHSMCVKYWAIQFFQIPVQGQDDADAESPQVEAKAPPAPQGNPSDRLLDLHAKMAEADSLGDLIALYDKGVSFINNRGLDESYVHALKQLAGEIAKVKGWR